jgi:DNA-directed RNA polymerase specialized sigma subunit
MIAPSLKIAERSTNPLDSLIAAEEKQKRMAEVRRGNRALNVLIKEGALTPRQALVYGLCYGKKLRENEVANLLGIAPRTVQRLRQKAREAFVRGLAEWRRGMVYIKKAAFCRLTRKQKKILKLRYREGLSVKEIAEMFGRTERSVQRVLSRTLKKIFSV